MTCCSRCSMAGIWFSVTDSDSPSRAAASQRRIASELDFRHCSVNTLRNRMGSPHLTRRGLLAALPALSGIGFGAKVRPPGPPRNVASTLAGVSGLITPVDRFFVRDHFQEPDLSLSDWKLKVEGHVSQPLEISFSDLILAPSVR